MDLELKSLGEPFSTVSAILLYKLLGPSIVYLGGRTKELAEKAVCNLERIFQDAIKKSKDTLDTPGDVPPRVLRGIVNEGAFCEDKIAVGYLGGVLASSRGDTKRDDRGVVMNALISRLSTYQLRTHYIVYHTVKELFNGSDKPIPSETSWGLSVSMPFLAYYLAMGFHEELNSRIPQTEDAARLSAIVEHTFFGLHKQGLIGLFRVDGGDNGTVQYSPSLLGTELFLWAYGMGDRPTRTYLDPTVSFPRDDSVLIAPKGHPLKVVEEGKEPRDVEGYWYTIWAEEQEMRQRRTPPPQ